MIRASVRQVWLVAMFAALLVPACYDNQVTPPPPPPSNSPPPPPPPPPAPVAQTIAKISGDGATRAGGGQVTLIVQVLGSTSLPFQGATVNWTATVGSGSVSPGSSSSAADGSATTTWTLPAAAAPGYQVTATLGGVPSAQQTFTAAVAACLNPVVITDDFSSDLGAGWSVTTIQNPSTLQATLAYQPTGGSTGGMAPNPGGYRHMQHQMTGAGTITVFHLRELPYDPDAPGNAIDHINYTEDQIEFNPPFQNAAVGWGFHFEQGGGRYVKSVGSAAYANLTWLGASILNLTPADFGKVSFGGGPIKFGFYRSNTNISSNPHTVTHGIDNWRVEICRK